VQVRTPGGRIVVLGRLGIELPGPESVAAHAALPGRRAELVFAFLAVEHHREVSRDELADALWPELLPDTWTAALRGVVSEVRRFLDSAGLDGREHLVVVRGGWQLWLPPGLTVDLDDARAAMAGARERHNAGEHAAAAALADKAASMAALPFLPHSDGSWVDGIRDELATIRSSALELAGRAHASAGDARAAVAAAEQLVRVEPYGESAHQLLIAVLGQAGDRAGARRAYDRCRAMLRDELHTVPSAETEAALTAAMARDPARAAATDSAHQPGPAGLESYTVLVVEDHDFQRRTTVALLHRLGVGRVLEAADGAAAVKLLGAGEPPDVVLCDIDLPELDGVEFIRHVASGGLACAVAIVSGLEHSMLDAVRAIGEGYGLQVLGAVEKPLTSRALAELMGAYRPPARASEPAGFLRLSVDDLDKGVLDGRLVAYLEPIADLGAGRIAVAEVVPRWLSGGAREPRAASFAAALERPETIRRLVERLFQLGCEAARELACGGFEIDVAVRIPGARLGDALLADRLAELAAAAGADPRRVVVIVEATALPGGAMLALEVLTRIRLKGFAIWLDGAGSGPLVDRAPLTGVRLPAPSAAVPGRENAAELEQAFAAVRMHGLLAVGTACTSEDELVLLLEVGASHAQGPLIGEPMPMARLAYWAPSWTPPALPPDVTP
jgi:DNA-binding SARP family transcriptional activator/EAL domain-containing protein (putative c-di-GMP-specific phosphodiesterase class I)